MSAAYSNLYLEQGSDFTTTITMTDVYGNLYDLTNFQAYSDIKKSYYAANAVGSFTATINASKGTLTLDMDSNNTSNLAPGRYVYDAKIVDNIHSIKIRVLEGILDVSPQVTTV